MHCEAKSPVLRTFDELVVVVLQRRALLRHGDLLPAVSTNSSAQGAVTSVRGWRLLKIARHREPTGRHNHGTQAAQAAAEKAGQSGGQAATTRAAVRAAYSLFSTRAPTAAVFSHPEA